MKTNKKGFTLIEILGAVTILGILSVVAIVSVNKVIENGKKKHYETAEKNLMLAGQSYSQQNRSVLPKVVGQKTKITLKELVNNNYIKQIKDYSDNDCDLEKSYVQVFKYSQSDYSYIAYLDCPKYSNKKENNDKKPTISIKITGDKEKTAKSQFTIEDENKLMSYSYIVYKGSKEVKNSGNVVLPKYDKKVEKELNLSSYTPGNLKIVVSATNIYGNSTTKTLEHNFEDLDKPKCIIKEEDQIEKSWTNSGSRKITVGCDDGDGSGCTRETYSKTFKNTTKYGTITIADEAGNTQKCEVSVFIDKDPPTLPTKGNIGTVSGRKTTGSIKAAASGSTDEHSGFKEYRYLVTNSSTTPTDKTKFTTNMSFTRSCGTSYYAWVIAVDNVGNMSEVKGLGNTADGANNYDKWTSCTEPCGTGTQTRTNSCALVTTGLSQACNTQACCSKTEKECEPFGSCSKKCGTGSKTRTCKDVSAYDNSIICKASYIDSASCNTQDCCSSVKYVNGTSCSKTCGGGTYNQLAYSNYNNQRCSSKDKTSGGSSCNTQSCGPPKHTHKLGVYGTTLKSCGYTLTCDTTHTKAYYGYCGVCWNYGKKTRVGGYYCPARGRDGCQWTGAPLYDTVVPD